MGFGRRGYENGDPRVPTMEAALDGLVEHYDHPDLREPVDRLEAAVVGAKGIRSNPDFPSGPGSAPRGSDVAFFTPRFSAARVDGWTAHVAEQLSNDALIRPLPSCISPQERHLP